MSVVIPTFNCAPYLIEAIRSVQAQTYPVHEIIVVDDGSTDGTAALVAELQDAVVYIRQANAGVSEARNAGLVMARGEYLAFLDADDYWAPEKLSLQMHVLQMCPDVDLVCSDFSLVNDRGDVRQARHIKEKYRFFRAYRLDWSDVFPSRRALGADGPEVWFGHVFRSLFLGNFINTSSVLMRRRALDRIGPFQPARHTQEDYEYWLRVAEGGDIAYVDQALLAFRSRDGQLTGADQRVRIAEDVLDVIEAIVPLARKTMSGKVIADRLSERCLELALARLGIADRVAAREAIREALAYRPRSVAAWAVLAWTWVPPAVSEPLRRMLAPVTKAFLAS